MKIKEKLKRFYDSEAWDVLRTILEIALLAIAITIIISFCRGVISAAKSEDYTEAYVICTPDNYVNVRVSPKRNSEALGYLEPGDSIWLDGRKKNGFYHCVRLSMEMCEGWIHAGYVVFDKPEYINSNATIVSKGRLAARKYVDGKRTRWLKTLATVKVYYMSAEWAVTNCGYVKSQYLELEGE